MEHPIAPLKNQEFSLALVNQCFLLLVKLKLSSIVGRHVGAVLMISKRLIHHDFSV